ncbi:lipocalin-like domain-containing protein [Aeromicrobium sp.]|uniref:lipocalin-like domain-containing protein n=1 Tax=Aeromicrobium sp. TaxID=1871063 RepID=UPI003C384A64
MSNIRSLLLGTWRLTSFETRHGDDPPTYPFGEDADGVLTYTDDGHMWAAVWRRDRPLFAIADQQAGTPDEYSAAVKTYIQYVGRFEYDDQNRSVTHHIEQSIFPNWNGSDQVRFVNIAGDHLELTTPPVEFGGLVIGSLAWRRS